MSWVLGSFTYTKKEFKDLTPSQVYYYNSVRDLNPSYKGEVFFSSDGTIWVVE